MAIIIIVITIIGLMVFLGCLSLPTNAQNVLKTIGSSGSGNGQLDDPKGVVVDTKGNLYVVDSGNNRIQEFDTNGKFIRTWCSFGTGEGQFNGPLGITLDYAQGYVFLTDTGNERVEKYTGN